jgi:hypothetical protein
MRMLTQYVSDKWVEQIMAAIKNEQANAQGLPTGFADGTTPPPELAAMAGQGQLAAGPQAPGGMDGLAVPNPAAASLAGQVAGGMGNQSLNRVAGAGGELPVSLAGGGV